MCLLLLPGPLPVDSATISDYREAPETGVVFEISFPPNNVFSRVNISYVEGTEPRSMLYKGSRLRLHRPGQGQDIGWSLRGLLKGGGGEHGRSNMASSMEEDPTPYLDINALLVCWHLLYALIVCCTS